VGILTSYKQWLEQEWQERGGILLEQERRTEHAVDAETEVFHGPDREI
jgi:hypothetical protein